jgi:alkaline phosphatase
MSKVQVARLSAVLGVVALLGGCALNPAKLLPGGKDKPPPVNPPVTEPQKQRVETPEFWRKDGQAIARQARKGQTDRTKAKNIILFVGEGMGISTVTAARILAGQNAGVTGEEQALSFERFPATALAKTYNFDRQAPGSAGAMTALLTGIKTLGSSVSMDQTVPEGECGTSENREPTILERAKASGLAAGLVTTGRVTRAGPAAAYAHASSPNWEVDDRVPQAAVEQGCLDIARQLVRFDQNGPLDVVFGGGRMAFKSSQTPESEGSERMGVRAGPDDLIQLWTQAAVDRDYIYAGSTLRGYKWKKAGPVLGLFAPDNMGYEADRRKDGAGEPSLTEMTLAAIEGLKRNREGYVLVVVASGIARGHDEGQAYLALNDAVELSNAVAAAAEATSAKDTLIIVTADHGSSLTLGGAAARGSWILGPAATLDRKMLGDAQGAPYPTLAYGGGKPRPTPAPPPPADNKAAAGFQQPAALALQVGPGSGEDVAVYARGPGSQWIHGVLDQHAIYWIMRAANPTLENGKPIRKIAGVTPPKLPAIKLPFGGDKKAEEKK